MVILWPIDVMTGQNNQFDLNETKKGPAMIFTSSSSIYCIDSLIRNIRSWNPWKPSWSTKTTLLILSNPVFSPLSTLLTRLTCLIGLRLSTQSL